MPNNVAGTTTKAGDGIRLSLLGGFGLVGHDGAFVLAREAQHLLALLALRDHLVPRAAIAGTLWPDATEVHAHASLRSALSRLGTLAQRAVVVTSSELALAPEIDVDLRRARALAHRLVEPGAMPLPEDLTATAIELLSQECLPDWYDDWAILESEQWRQLRLHALDALAYHLSAAGRHGDAIAAALAAMRADPLRESACAALIRVHLAEGNQSEAIRAFTRYEALLMRELGIQPTAALRDLVAPSP